MSATFNIMQGQDWATARKYYALPDRSGKGNLAFLACLQNFSVIQNFCISLLTEATEMKTLRRICAATVLSLTLAISALAGDVHSPGVASTGTSTVTTIVTTVVSLIY